MKPSTPKSPWISAAWLLILAALIPLSACLAPKPFDENAWRRKVETQKVSDLYAPHRDARGIFFNPWLKQNRSILNFFRWRLSANSLGNQADLDLPTPTEANSGDYLKDPAAPASITWVGHATYVIQWSGQVILTDPFFGGWAAIAPRIIPPAFGQEAIPPGAIVLISHNHYDHLDSDSVAALAGRVRFLCPLGLGDLLKEMGAKDVVEMDWWQSIEINGSTFTCLPAQHWSRRLGQGFNESLWCAWMAQRNGKKVFYGGDSGYFIGFKEIGRRFPGIEAALLPVGASQPRWFMHYPHMDVPEALKAFADLKAKYMTPTQWGVMGLGDEPAAWPIKILKEQAEQTPALRDKIKILPVGGRLLLD